MNITMKRLAELPQCGPALGAIARCIFHHIRKCLLLQTVFDMKQMFHWGYSFSTTSNIFQLSEGFVAFGDRRAAFCCAFT